MSLGLGLGRGGGGGGITASTSRTALVDLTDGSNYDALSITSTSAGTTTGPLVITDTGIEGKPAGYPGGLIGARVSGGAPAWTSSGGSPLPGVTWRGPLPAATTINAYSKPTPGTNGWLLAGATDSGDVPGPDGNATSARRITFTGADQQVYRTQNGSTSSAIWNGVIIKGTNGNKINLYYGSGNASVNWQMTLNGEWQALSEIGTVTGTPTGVYLSLNNSNNTGFGGAGATSSQTVDVFMLQVSTAPFPLIATTGTNLTRLAETVTKTVTAVGASFSLKAELNYSAGLPAAEQAIVTSGADVMSITTSGNVKVTDGALTTTSTATLSAAAEQNAALSRVASGAFMAVGTTVEAAEAVNWSGDTTLTLGGPIQRLEVWNRDISLTEGTA